MPDSTREVAPFLKSLRLMLERESAAVLRWTDDGKAFEIHDLQRMTREVLPKYFKHAKYASFQRQLNYFNFRKWTKSKAVVCTFSNPFFVRDDPALTWRITRKRALTHSSKANVSASNDKDKTPRQPVKSSISRSPKLIDESVGKAEDSESDEDAANAAFGSLDWIDTLYPSLELLLQSDSAIDDSMSSLPSSGASFDLFGQPSSAFPASTWAWHPSAGLAL